jgi:predicted nucleotidyltransferase
LQVYEEIDRITKNIKEIDGVIGIVLFGSYSRGDYDEGSDIDLLVVFENKKNLDVGLKDVYQITANTNLFFQAIGLTLDELRNSPILETVLREGKIYFATQKASRLLTTKHKPYALVTYSTANLRPKQRVLFSQKLEGRRQNQYRYEGLIHKMGGHKVGRGVLMVPLKNLKTLTEQFEQERIEYVLRYVWV